MNPSPDGTPMPQDPQGTYLARALQQLPNAGRAHRALADAEVAAAPLQRI